MDTTGKSASAQPFAPGPRGNFGLNFIAHEGDLAAALQKLLDHPCICHEVESKRRLIELAYELSLLSANGTYELMLEHNGIEGRV
jgi:hypothetical protein